ncbi:MAG: flippase [Chloroflexota bacterium]
MSNNTKTIAKNASALMLSQLITWAMAFVLMIFLPRYLGAVGVGKFQLATSLWAIVGIVVSFGIDTYMTKEIARVPEKLNQLFSAAVVLQIALFILGTGGMALYVQVAGYPEDTILIIAIIGIATLLGQLSIASRAALSALERMEFVSLADVIGKGIATLLSIIFLLLGYDIVTIALISVLGNVANLVVQLVSLHRVQPLHFHRVDFSLALDVLKSGFPFLILSGFLVFYAQVDIIIISLLVNEEALGWYGVADRFFTTFLFIPTVFVAAVFPALSRMHKDDSEKATRVSRLGFDLLLLTAVPLGFGLIAISDPLIALIFGPGFAESSPILKVFGVVLILTYQNILIGSFLITSDRQRPWSKIIIIATIISIPLDLVLVPWCQTVFNNGAIGGAIAFVITEAFMLIGGIRLLPPGTLDRTNVSFAARTLLAGGIMFASVWGLRDLFLLIPIVVGAAIYLACIILLRLVSPETQQIMKYVSQGVLDKLRAKQVQPASNTFE